MTSNTEKSLQILKEEIQRLEEQGISGHILEELMEFRRENDTGDAAEERCIRPQIPFFGKEVLEMAIAALLAGENVLLCGGKATGKNILAENLAWLFRRPTYNISFHVNTDSSTLIGTDTFRNNEVQLREGPIIQCAKTGGFGILDEINMAKNDAVSVLHATLDYRRAIDVPGYERVALHPATRFIGTMNYGYAGTKELNEALVSRFVVINMPSPDEETLNHILKSMYPTLKESAAEQFVGLFLDLQTKAQNSEISAKALDLRGLLAAIGLMKTGLYQGSPTEIPYVDQDFMFAAIAEEMGSIFCICTILICMSCFIMFVNIAMKMTKNFYRYVALGLACTYAIQVFLTIGGSMKMIPMTGVTLPFVSSGGSSMLSTLIMFSVIQGLYILRKDEDDSFEDEEYYEEPQNYR